jgi:hypothetical protein
VFSCAWQGVRTAGPARPTAGTSVASGFAPGHRQADALSHTVTRIVMEAYAPQFSRYWLPAGDADASRASERDDHDAAERQALEELAERVNAARSIV